VILTAARQRFTDAVEAWLETVAVGDNSRAAYWSVYRANVKGAYAGVSVRDAAGGRARAEELLNVTMIGKSLATRRLARLIPTSVLEHLVVAGPIASHRLAGIKLAERTVSEDEYTAGYVVLTDRQVSELAARCGDWVTVQRALGLRISEVVGANRQFSARERNP
jgi:hypothetical protein